MVTISVDVDIPLDDVDDCDLVDELESRGFKCSREDYSSVMDKYDWQQMLEIMNEQPRGIYSDRLREKILEIMKTEG